MTARETAGAIIIGIAVAVTIVAGVLLSQRTEERIEYAPFTVLSVTETDSRTLTATVDVVNHERDTVDYVIVFAAASLESPKSASFTLEPGQRWTRQVSLASAGTIAANLYIDEARGVPYRHIRFDVPETGRSAD